MNTEYLTNEGLKVIFIPLKKFKTIQLSFKMMNSFETDTINQRSLIPQILLAGTKHFPNKKVLQEQLDKNFGMELSASTKRIGNQSVVSFDMSVVSESCLPKEEHLLEDALALLSDILLSPRLRNHCFLKSIVEEEKRLLRDELEAIYHDKQEYSFELFKNHMFSGERFRYNPKGNLLTLDSFDETSLTAHYQKMLVEDEAELYVAGDFDQEQMKKLIKKYLPLSSSPQTGSFVDLEKGMHPEQFIKEKGDVAQTRMTMGYRTEVHSTHPLFTAMTLFNILFGESDQSKLFQSIREKHQMSYYVSSAYVSSKSVLFVFAGIRHQEETFVKSLIQEALEDIIKGHFSEEDLALSKQMALSRMKKSQDSQGLIIARYFMSYHLENRPYDLILSTERIQAVTKEDVIKAAKTLTLDTIHVYEGGEPFHE